MNYRFSAHLELAKSYWTKHLKAQDTVIDATCGNGYDTLFLTQFPLKALFAIDIQPEAIKKTKELLDQHKRSHLVSLHEGSHASFQWISPPPTVNLIVYNLGYLPKGDKTLTTQTETTLSSLNAALELLRDKGALSITCYPGHEEGAKEHEAILSWGEKLDPKKWDLCHHQWLNRPLSPTFLWIVKK